MLAPHHPPFQNRALQDVAHVVKADTLLRKFFGNDRQRSARGFARLQALPHQTVRDWLLIADLEREKEKHDASR